MRATIDTGIENPVKNLPAALCKYLPKKGVKSSAIYQRMISFGVQFWLVDRFNLRYIQAIPSTNNTLTNRTDSNTRIDHAPERVF